MDRCAECGFAYDLDLAAAAAGSIVAAATDLASLLAGANVERRRRPEVWSPLEYGCHVRDVLLVQRERVLEARRTEHPSFTPMGRDDRVEHDGYAGQQPSRVAVQLTEAAHMFANVLDRLNPPDWERTVFYNYPTRMQRSLRWVAVQTVHEVRHHLADVRRQLI